MVDNSYHASSYKGKTAGDAARTRALNRRRFNVRAERCGCPLGVLRSTSFVICNAMFISSRLGR